MRKLIIEFTLSGNLEFKYKDKTATWVVAEWDWFRNIPFDAVGYKILSDSAPPTQKKEIRKENNRD